MQDGTKMITDTNTENPQPSQKSEETNKKFVVARLDIYHAPGWFDLQRYDNEHDAVIYCDMLNQDTNMIHCVFVEGEE